MIVNFVNIGKILKVEKYAVEYKALIIENTWAKSVHWASFRKKKSVLNVRSVPITALHCTLSAPTTHQKFHSRIIL